MTTNRVDDVDDAILSRCVATNRYETPSKPDAMRLWRLLAEQLRAELSDALIGELRNVYPRASGRDIKELLKLTTRSCNAKGIPFSAETFRLCALFRGYG